MNNLVKEIKNQKFVAEFGITEAFFVNGEFYLTSKYEVSLENYDRLEEELKNI